MEDKEYRKPENGDKKNVWGKIGVAICSFLLAVLTVVIINL